MAGKSNNPGTSTTPAVDKSIVVPKKSIGQNMAVNLLQLNVDTENKSVNSIQSLVGLNGLSQSDIDHLISSGYSSVNSIASANKTNLLSVNTMTESKVDRLLAAVNSQSTICFTTAFKVMEDELKLGCISSGSKAIDDILGGGFPVGCITQIYGTSGSGKTQICHTLAITVQKSVAGGGLNFPSIFIDTEGTFRTERLKSAAIAHGLEYEDALKKVSCARAFNSAEMLKLIDLAESMLQDARYGIVIVDSIIALLRTEFQQMSRLQEKQSLLAKILAQLSRLATEHRCAVIITNQMVTNMNQSNLVLNAPTSIPCGGNVMSHSCQLILEVKKLNSGRRLLRIIKSPNLLVRAALFQINECLSDVGESFGESP